MAEPIVPEVNAMLQLAHAIDKLEVSAKQQGVLVNIEAFTGEPKKFKKWMSQIEKCAFVLNANEEEIKKIAFKGSTGYVSDFIRRKLEADPTQDWDDFKRELAHRYAEVTDPQYTFSLLRQIKQAPNENIQTYADKLIKIAENAFVLQNITAEEIDAHLVGIFLDGVYSDFLKLKLMCDNAQRLAQAIKIALTEERIRRRFNLRVGREPRNEPPNRRKEPMDVGHMRPQWRRGI